MFESKRLRLIGLDPSTLYPDVKPRPPPLLVGSASCEEVPKEPSVIRRLLSRRKSTGAATSGSSCAEQETPALVSEEEEDLKDALSPIYDQLKLQRAWWILEAIPLRFRHQRSSNDKWVNHIR